MAKASIARSILLLIRSIVSSGVYKNLAREVRATTLVASVLLAYNAAAGGITDFSGAEHEALLPWLPLISLPLTPFTLSSPSLGLLLGKPAFGGSYLQLTWCL